MNGVSPRPLFSFVVAIRLTVIGYELAYALHFFDAWSLPRK